MTKIDETLCGGIPDIFVEDALARLRDIPDGEERRRELKKYGRLEIFLADRLREDKMSRFDSKPEASVESGGRPGKGSEDSFFRRTHV